MEGHAGPVTDVAFNPDGDTLASASADGNALLLDVSTPQPDAQPRVGFSVRLVFDRVGHRVQPPTARSSRRRAARLLRGRLLERARNPALGPGLGKPLGVALEGSAEKMGIAFSVDGGLLAGTTASDTVVLWNVAQGRPEGRPLQEEGVYITDVEFSPDGTLLAALRAERLPGQDPRSDALALGDPEVRLWALDSFEPAGEPFAEKAKRLVFSPDGRGLFIADGRLRLWGTSGAPHPEQVVDAEGVTQFALSANGTRLATFGIEGMILWDLGSAWDLASASRLGEPIQAHRGDVTSASVQPRRIGPRHGRRRRNAEAVGRRGPP